MSPGNIQSTPTVGPLSGDALDRVAETVLGIPQVSWRSLAIAACALLAGAVLQTTIAATGASGIPFMGFFPPIMATAIVAGVAAGVVTAIGSFLVLWWAFWEPEFVFHDLSFHQRVESVWFFISAISFIAFGFLCRTLLIRAGLRQRALMMLTREMKHRSGNTFAVIEAITRKTLEAHPDSAKALLNRFEAIRRSSELLTRAADGAPLTEVLNAEFEGIKPHQLQMHGAEVRLPVDLARNLVLIVHELMTNAIKYGALSVSTGQVVIHWRRADDRLIFSWEERGGPPVRSPSRKGFGSTLLDHCVRSLGGDWNACFAPEGFRCTLDFKIRNEGAPKAL